MSLKLGNLAELAAALGAVTTSGGQPPVGAWFDGRVVGVLATPADGTAEHLAVGVSALPPGAAAPPHTHRAEEIAIVMSGAGQIVIDDEPIEVVAGDAVRTPSHAAHTTIAGAAEPLLILWTYAPAGSEGRWLAESDPEAGPDPDGAR